MDKALKKDQVLNDQTTVEVKPLKTKKRKSKSLEKQKSVFGWLFILPFLLGFVLIYLPMIISSIQISFSSIAYEDIGQVLTWVGFKNYSYALFEDADFAKTLNECLVLLSVGVLGNVTDMGCHIFNTDFLCKIRTGL